MYKAFKILSQTKITSLLRGPIILYVREVNRRELRQDTHACQVELIDSLLIEAINDFECERGKNECKKQEKKRERKDDGDGEGESEGSTEEMADVCPTLNHRCATHLGDTQSCGDPFLTCKKREKSNDYNTSHLRTLMYAQLRSSVPY